MDKSHFTNCLSALSPFVYVNGCQKRTSKKDPNTFAAGVLLGSIQFCHPVQKSPEKKTGNFSLVLKRCMYVGASASMTRVVATSDGSDHPGTHVLEQSWCNGLG